MNRRQLLIALASAAPLGAMGLLLPRRTFFLPPAATWVHPDGGWIALITDTGPINLTGHEWASATPAQILEDINRLLNEMWRFPYSVVPDRMVLTPARYALYQELKADGLVP